MPSPGATAIADTIASKGYQVEGNFATSFTVDNPFVSKLSVAIHNGWTSSSPSTTTSMGGSFNAELSVFVQGNGLLFINCIAQGIDTETSDWASSWNGGVHTFAVSASSIVDRILVCTPLVSNGVQALAEAVAEAFVSGFGQETG